MKPPPSVRIGFTLCVLACALLAAKLPLDLAGSTWTLPLMKAKVSVKVGKAKDTNKAAEAMTLRLHPGDVWALESASFADMSGTYTRKSDSARKLIYTASPTSLQNVADQLEQDIEDALDDQGINAVLTLTMTNGKVTTGLKIKKKANTVRAKVGMALKFSGTVVGSNGTFGSKISAKAKGLSDPNTLDSITN